MTFEDALSQAGLGPLRRAAPSWLQINLGKRCNQTCAHCHVDAGPHRKEQMSDEVVEDVLRALSQNPSFTLLDITGGAPELLGGGESVKAEIAHLLDQVDREVVVLVPLRDVWRNLRLSELTDAATEGLMLAGQGEVHESDVNNR